MPHENVVNNNTDNAWEPKIIAFLCNWCSYAGADLAGTGRIQYPPNIRIIRVPCSGSPRNCRTSRYRHSRQKQEA